MAENSNEQEIMTIEQLAEYLQLSETTTYKLVQNGTIPAFKLGRHWRVRKKGLEELLERPENGERL